MKEIFCTNCGEKVRIDEDREFCFCTNCGFKIVNRIKRNETIDVSESAVTLNLEDKLKEVDFYYSMSRQKMEAKDKDKNPVYYLKGQDLLLDLAKQFPDDYRIWWELSKPVDFELVEKAYDVENVFRFNEVYFNKAVDLAQISMKKEIIEQRELYDNEKNKLVAEYEERKKQLECEQEQRERLEQEEQERVQAERKREEEEQERLLAQRIEQENQQIWEELSKGKYESVNDTFFGIRESNDEKCVGTLKVIANVLYLNTFIENKMKKCVYYGQNFMVKFNGNGELVHYDNKVIRKKENSGEWSILQISSLGNGKIGMNGNEMEKNVEYITWLMTNGKKLLFGNDKTLI